ncbi:hypothetical protein NDU88_001931 [Pleurodeles waltl]|uniref:Uncharacterized protein n=1 Tax=Pleurodeles waltl TaxID=8319 RepID=A0AAV7UXH4_PLEWA|nr:hypothetical protein NDU88_001931 [Pleurodeles waltl]
MKNNNQKADDKEKDEKDKVVIEARTCGGGRGRKERGRGGHRQPQVTEPPKETGYACIKATNHGEHGGPAFAYAQWGGKGETDPRAQTRPRPARSPTPVTQAQAHEAGRPDTEPSGGGGRTRQRYNAQPRPALTSSSAPPATAPPAQACSKQAAAPATLHHRGSGPGARGREARVGSPLRRERDQLGIQEGCTGSKRHPLPSWRARLAPPGAGAGRVSHSQPQETRPRIGFSAPKIFGAPSSRKRASSSHSRG